MVNYTWYVLRKPRHADSHNSSLQVGDVVMVGRGKDWNATRERNSVSISSQSDNDLTNEVWYDFIPKVSLLLDIETILNTGLSRYATCSRSV